MTSAYVPASVVHRWGSHTLDGITIELATERGGKPVPLTSAEITEAVRKLDQQLDERGRPMSARLIAVRLGCTNRTVHRHRKIIRAGGAR